MSSVPHSLVTAKRCRNSELGSTEIERLVCTRCQPTEAENAGLKQALQTISDENTELMRQVAGLMDTVNTLGKQKQALKQELNRVREEEPGNDVVKTVLQHWMRVTGRDKRKGRKANISMAGVRAQVVKKALRFHTAEEIILAIDGLALLPYVGVKGRKATGTDKERYDEVKHCLADEEKVDRFIGYAQRAARAAAEQRDTIWDTYWRINALEHEWARLALNATAAVEQGIETSDLEGLLLSREAASDARWAEILSVDAPLEMAA